MRIAKDGGTNPENPTSFCMLLRKYLEGKIIESIEQAGFERILKISTRNAELIIEMFSSGNIILCSSGEIVMPMRREEWKEREIKPKVMYKGPPETPGPFSPSLFSSDKEIVKALATDMGLSGVYAEEVCSRALVEKSKKCAELSDDERRRIEESIEGILSERLVPAIIFENAKKIDVVPFELKIYQDFEKKQFESFSEALDEYFKEEKKVESNEALEKIRAEQAHSLAKWEDEEQEARENANLILGNYSEVENAIGKRMGKAMIGGKEVSIDPKKNARENASAYFEKAKMAKQKAENAKGSLQMDIKIKERRVEKKAAAEKKQSWHSRFHHFTTTEGFLVIGGKNADQNEEIVKRRAEDGDIVLHADIVGAPFTVVKSEGKRVTEKAIREAAVLAACYSRAWKLGHGNVEVYWVTPSQLSKEAPAGEFIGKGAFMVRGKKNYLGKIALELSLGFDGHEVHVCNNDSRKRMKIAFTIRPGDMEKEEAAKKILATMSEKGYKATLDEIKQRLPGNCAIF